MAQAITLSLQKHAEREEGERQARVKDFYLAMLGGLYDKASAYVALIIGLGYVGFFAIWGWVNPFLSRWEILTTASLLGFSLLVFIVWEIYAMFNISMQQRRLAKIILATPENFVAIEKEQKEAEATAAARLSMVWPVMFISSTLPGVLGGVILLIGCIRRVFS